MKNHVEVDGKLLQTNKKYSQLKQKQKDEIYQWMYRSYRDFYQKTGRYPAKKDEFEVLGSVFENIEKAGIWIPDGEVTRHYESIVSKLGARLRREQANYVPLELEALPVNLSVCKVADYSMVDWSKSFTFTGLTDHENSLVCPTDAVPDNILVRDDGWRAFRIVGQMEFSLIGILARISRILAGNQIGIFAVSTFDTDYVLTKEENYEKALKALKNAGYKLAE